MRPADLSCHRPNGGACSGRFARDNQCAHSHAYRAQPRGILLLRAHAIDGATNTKTPETRDTAPPTDLLRFQPCACGSRSSPRRDALTHSLPHSPRRRLRLGHYFFNPPNKLRVAKHASRFEEVLNLEEQLVDCAILSREF